MDTAQAVRVMTPEQWAAVDSLKGFAQFSALRLDGRPLSECPFHSVTRDVRLYYQPDEAQRGFYFMAVRWATEVGTLDAGFAAPNLGVECLFHGTARFDGVRHLWFGHEASDNKGYLYYPDHAALADALRMLAGLEMSHCSPADLPRRR